MKYSTTSHKTIPEKKGLQIMPVEPAVEIDLNDRDEQGRSLVFQKQANTLLVEGMAVLAYETEEHVIADAVVVSVNRRRRTAYIEVDWSSMRTGRPNYI
jgi:hypothetical protein